MRSTFKFVVFESVQCINFKDSKKIKMFLENHKGIIRVPMRLIPPFQSVKSHQQRCRFCI